MLPTWQQANFRSAAVETKKNKKTKISIFLLEYAVWILCKWVEPWRCVLTSSFDEWRPNTFSPAKPQACGCSASLIFFFHFYRANWLFCLFRNTSDVTAADSLWSTVTAPSKVWKQSATFCRLSSNTSTARNNLPTPVWWVQISRFSKQECFHNIPKLLLGSKNLALFPQIWHNWKGWGPEEQ